MMFFLYSVYSLYEYQHSLEKGTQVEKIVISQSCRAYTKLSSGVIINEGSKKYNVKLDYGNCIKYPKNSKIKVIYDKDKDIFIYRVKVPNYGRIYFIGIILIVFLLPWSYIINMLGYKK